MRRETIIVRLTVLLTVLAVLVVSTGVSTSQPAKRVTIVGLPPYEFGAPMEVILKANPTLQQVPPNWVGVLTYRGRFEFYIPGTISVYFWEQKLVYIWISWLRLRDYEVKFMYQSIIDSYDLTVMNVTHHFVNPAGAVLAFEDVEGSRLDFSGIAGSSTGGELRYQWGAFRKANVPLAPRF